MVGADGPLQQALCAAAGETTSASATCGWPLLTLLALTVSSIHKVVERVLVTCECELAVVRWALLQALDGYCAEVAWNHRAGTDQRVRGASGMEGSA